MIKVRGHRLETVSVRGGLMGSCSCGSLDAVYSDDRNGRSTSIFATWHRDWISAAHQAHLRTVKGTP